MSILNNDDRIFALKTLLLSLLLRVQKASKISIIFKSHFFIKFTFIVDQICFNTAAVVAEFVEKIRTWAHYKANRPAYVYSYCLEAHRSLE